MNILVIGPIPKQFGGKEFGGIATHIYGFINESLRKDLKISLWYHKQAYKKRSVPVGLEVVDNKFILLLKMIPCLTLFFHSKISFLNYKSRLILCYQYICLKEHLKKRRIDIIHVHSLQNTSTLALKLLGEKYLKTPVVITDHGFWQLDVRPNRLKLLKINSEYAKKVIYISDFAYKHHQKYNFCKDFKLIKIPNPIVFEKISLIEKSNSEKVLFFNGLTESVKRKGFPELIDAINSSNYLCKNIKLVAIVNENGENYIKTIKTNFKYTLLPKLGWEDIKKIYLESDLMVLPSKSESFGLVYIEALMFGIPIVGFNEVVDEFKNVFKEYYIGESYNPEEDSPNHLAAQIVKALSTPFHTENVIKVVKENYSWDNKINDFIHLYELLIKKNVSNHGI